LHADKNKDHYNLKTYLLLGEKIIIKINPQAQESVYLIFINIKIVTYL